MSNSVTTALIVVDVQKDFLPGGALAVPDGNKVIPVIQKFSELVSHVVLTRDFHPPNHISFADPPHFEDKSWPAHCVANTEGAAFDEDLARLFWDKPVFSKGTNPEQEAYSGFDGRHNNQLLDYYLDDLGVTRVFVAGLALDYCVKATALDAVLYGYDTFVLIDGTRPVAYETGIMATATMADDGVVFGTTNSLQIAAAVHE